MEQKTKTNRENEMAMFIHLSTLLGYLVPFANIIAPFVIWQMKKDEMPHLEAHAKEAINFQISLTIYMLISAILVFIIIGVAAVFALMILGLIFTIQASMAANNGKIYHYPITIRFIK